MVNAFAYEEPTRKFPTAEDSERFHNQLKERPPRPHPVPCEEHHATVPGGSIGDTWTMQIVDNINYNWYHVQIVEVQEIGALPVVIGGVRSACNLAESFLSAGTLPAYTYGVMWRVGPYYVFSREP